MEVIDAWELVVGSTCNWRLDAFPWELLLRYRRKTNGHEESQGLATIRMKPDDQGRFGFNVKGGADQNLPILVSRVAPNTPADTCIPRLNEGDQVLMINGREVAGLTHDQVVKLIRASRERHPAELLLTVRPNVYVGEDVEEPDFQYIPDARHVSSKVPRSDVLSESMLLLSDGLESGATIAQFEQLYRKKPGMCMNIAKLPENLNKNRYRDISPYDSTRVVLLGSPSGDYINASHVHMEIPTSGIVNRYIATQGPLPTTTFDFWLMVWEQQSTLVVMVTTLMERGRSKCHKYWPKLYESLEIGFLQVTCIREQETSSFAFREFTLINTENKEERHITHMQYTAWPDHGVPDDASDFLDFVMQVRQNRVGMVESAIVHCSAGIGRTGVLILMETAMCLIEANEPVYPLDIVKAMRDQRAMLIQTTSQYKFVCEAILKVYNERIVKPLKEYQR
ncbi:Tyrosine-protein phosphatase 1 [Araneus ventricosus]|uniref:Tyrosine-protein phosphatase 1 n=1 Tax=Araneus ventricosus TaxID=182803 RepID=A0A4Y2B7K1_ARAVE|nr:Tyrosine-protein phosphatase 1 [Araneus ventricosus]